jgi:hypothetical protein
MLVGCGSSDGASQTQDPTSPGGGGTTAGPADNLPSASPSTCGAPGQAPGDAFFASCADGATVPVITEAEGRTFCADKRFGTFFWEDETLGPDKVRWLYFCTSPTTRERYPFAEDYTHVVVANVGNNVLGIALGPGNGYRCYSRDLSASNWQIVTSEPLPLGKELKKCPDFTVVERSEAVMKVTLRGHTLQMIAHGGGPSAAPPPAATTPCEELRERCCPQASDPAVCAQVADAYAAEGNQTACQNRIDTICH